MTKFLSDRVGEHDLADIRQLCDLDTEEAQEDLWTRHQLTPGAALDLLAEVDRDQMRPPPAKRGKQRRQRPPQARARPESWRVSA